MILPQYQLYQMDEHNKPIGPPVEFEWPNDAVAICKSVRRVNGRSVELWENARLIVRLESRRIHGH